MAVSAFTKRLSQENKARLEGRAVRPSSSTETKNVSDFTKKLSQENRDRLASNELAAASWSTPDAQSAQRMQRARDNLSALTVSGMKDVEKARTDAAKEMTSGPIVLGGSKNDKASGAKKAGTFGGQTTEHTEKAFSGQRKTAEDQPDWGTIAYGTLGRGAGQFDKSITATASALEQLVSRPLGLVLGNSELYKDAPLYQLNQWVDRKTAALEESMAPEYEKGGTAGELVGKYGPGVVSAVPQAAAAFLTHGASLAAQGTTAGLQAASMGGGVASTVLSAMRQTAQNPQFWLSFASTAGNEYEQALEDGADVPTAFAYAALAGGLNSVVEVGGGIDTLPDGDKGLLKEWVKSMLDEGKEEVIQGAVSRVLQRGMYGKNNPLASLTDENAILNPNRMKEEFLGGAVVGGILGGAQMGAQAAINRSFSQEVARQLGGRETARGVQETGQANAQIPRLESQTETAQNKNTAARPAAVRADTSLFDRAVLRNFNQARQYFVEFARKRFPASAVNRETGKEIGISRTGIDKFLSGNILYEKYASGFHIPELIENAHKVGDAANYHPETAESVPTFEYYDSGIEIDGKPYNAHIRVKNTLVGDKYYGHTISEVDSIEIEPPTRTPSDLTNQTVQPGNTGGSIVTIPQREATVKPREGTQQGAEIPSHVRLSRADRRMLQNLARITGSDIQFVPRAQLEQMSGPGAEGMQLNGQIYISEDAARPYMEIARHELTHRMQQTAPEDYARFRDYAIEAYREGGVLDAYVRGVMENRARAGLEISEDAAMDEIAADFAANLLVDEKAVRRLAGENRGLLKRMLDALREFIARVKTALGGKGSAQTEELEQAAALWQRALETSARNSGAEGDGQTRYSIEYDRENRPFVSVEEDILDGVPRADWVRTVKDNLRKKFPSGVAVGNNEIKINAKSRNEIVGSRYSQYLRDFKPELYADKLRSTNNVDEILQASRDYIGEGLNHPRNDNIREFSRGTVQLRIGGNDYTADVVVGTTAQNQLILYDLLNLQKTSINDKQARTLAAPEVDGLHQRTSSPVEPTLPQSAQEVNTPKTFSEEIARQLRGETASTEETDRRLSTQEGADLKKQVDALRRQNQRLKEQMKRTDGAEMDETSVRRLSKSLLKDYNSAYAAEDLTVRVGDLYKKIAEQTVSQQDARAEARDIAMDILDGSQTEMNPLYSEYSTLRNELRTRPMSIAPEYRADLDPEGGYDSVRKRYMGRLKLTNDGAAIDQVYDDLSTRYPELFPEDVYNPADQLSRIMEVSDELQSGMGNPYEGGEVDRAADFLAGDILERFYETPERAPTFADRQERRLQNQRVKDRARLDRAVEREQGRTQRAQRALQRQKTEDRTRLLEAVGKERGRKNEALQALKDKHRAANKKRTENLNAAQRREQIIRHSKKLSEKLLRPTDKQHIPEDLRGAALSLLRSIDMSSTYEYGPDGKLPVGTGEKLIGEQMGIPEIVQTKRTQAARELQAQYAKLAGEEGMVVDPDLAGYLDEIAGFGDTPLGNLSRNQLETVWNAVKAVETSVSQADKMLGQSRYKTVSELAETIRADNRTKRDRRTAANPVLRAVDNLINVDMMTPETFLHKLGPGGEAVYQSMRRAADRQTVILKEGVDQAKALVEETGVDLNKAAKEMHTFQTEGGDSLDLTTAQIMELYALSKREQALEHLYKGGIKPTGARKGFFQAEKAAPVHVTAADVAEMVDTLTAEQKKLVDGLQSYLSTELSAHGNDASMEAYGYKKFKEKNYWPIKVDQNQTRTDPNADPVSTAPKTVSGYGMAKNVKQNANNAVTLRGALDTFTDHLNEMATYAAWLGTSEDLNRLQNYRFRDGKGNVEGTFKTLLEQVYGKGGKTYLGSLLTDIAAGTKVGAERSGTDALFNTWKAAKVGGNIRVVLQQPTAIIRAANMIDPKYFAQAKSPMKGWETAVEHSPIAQWKDWGYFELDTGRSLKELIAGTDKALDKAKNAMMSPAGMADSIAWGHLWNAVEAETADRHKNLQRGSDEFYEKAAARFGEIIDRTQVVDSVLHRTQIMRSGNAVNRMATSFMSEPSKIYNMVYRDIWDLAHAEKGQRGKPAKALARSAAALIASFAVNAIAQSLPDAWRDKDRDESFRERFSDAWAGNFLDNFDPIGYIPYLKDVESIIQGYDVSRSDMEGITEIVEAGKDLYKAVNGQSKKTALSSGIDATARILDLLGLPAYNIKRDVYAILQHTLIDAGADNLLYELDKLMVNPSKDSKTFYDDLYRTMGKDYDQYKSVYQNMIEQSWTSGDELKSAMEKRMAKDLGLDKPSSLPVEYSPPGSGGFDEEVRRQLERGGSWRDTLPKDSGDLAGRLDQLKPEEGENSVTKRQRIRDIRDAPYSDEAKDLSVKRLLGKTELERYEAAKKAGISVDAWCRLYEDIASAHEKRTGKSGSASKQDVALVLDSAALTDKQKDAVWESYGWTSDWRDSVVGKDLSDGAREKVGSILSGLEPEEGEKTVSVQQKCDAIAESGLSEKDMLGALETVMGAGEREKLSAAYGQGVSPADYVSARGKMAEYDEDGNGTITQDEAQKAIKSMGFLSKEEKAAVWQAQNKSWKPENNPFHKKTGRAVYDALHEGDEED